MRAGSLCKFSNAFLCIFITKAVHSYRILKQIHQILRILHNICGPLADPDPVLVVDVGPVGHEVEDPLGGVAGELAVVTWQQDEHDRDLCGRPRLAQMRVFVSFDSHTSLRQKCACVNSIEHRKACCPASEWLFPL